MLHVALETTLCEPIGDQQRLRILQRITQSAPTPAASEAWTVASGLVALQQVSAMATIPSGPSCTHCLEQQRAHAMRTSATTAKACK